MWNYNDKVMDYFLNPRNVGEVENPDGTGEVGNMTCGDALKFTFKLDKDGRIAEAKFKTFGCASAIASSSALTELVKGMTLEEAAKITNNDIVAILGDLPEEKMHCSVMGMEALQAAIADYKGEQNPLDRDEDHDGAIVCKCFGVTDAKIKKVAKVNNLHKAEEITHYCKAGGACGACIDQIQQILDELWQAEPAATAGQDRKEAEFAKLPFVQKVMKIQEVIDREIKPLLEHDGGSIELIDLKGSEVMVQLQGVCATCPASQVTLKNTVEDKLHEFVSHDLTVVNQAR